MSRILLYGDVDLNLVDGSAIWLTSLAEVLAGLSGVHVAVLLRASLSRNILTSELEQRPNVQFLDPWQMAKTSQTIAAHLRSNRGPRLQATVAAQIIRALDEQRAFETVVVRSIPTALLLSTIPGVGRKLWVYLTDPRRHRTARNLAELGALYRSCHRFLCQTEEALDEFAARLQLPDRSKLLVLPPMIPEIPADECEDVSFATPRLGYSGKFSPPYRIEEMLSAFRSIRERTPNAEFHIVGDKFHNSPPVANFSERVEHALRNTPGVIWHGGVPRTRANDIMRRVHVAASWRDNSFDESLEISTKILEYASLGRPILMNAVGVQKRVFGDDYPGYVLTQQDFVSRFHDLTSDQDLYRITSEHVRSVAAHFTFGHIRDRLRPHIPSCDTSVTCASKQRLLFVGHDLKFLRPIVRHFQSDDSFAVMTHEYAGHSLKRQDQVERHMAESDVVFCEWCLGNAEWISKHKVQGTKIIVRLHAQEVDEKLHYLDRVVWENVDCIVFICPRIMDEFLRQRPHLSGKAQLIFNAIDCSEFEQPKLPGAEFNLGFMGLCPRLKAPHRALEILRRLRQRDRRYTLHFKGRMPWDYAWLWQRDGDRAYYERFFDEVSRCEYRNALVFDPHGNDVAEWFTKIGFILSTSDREGSHQAVAEGMASGSIPIIRNWDGAKMLYPHDQVFTAPDVAVRLITQLHGPEQYETSVSAMQQFARRHFDLSAVLSSFDALLAGRR